MTLPLDIPARGRRSRGGGFTLVEAVLAVALTVAMSGGMLGLYLQGLKIRDRVSEQMDFMLAERLIMDRMTRELRSATECRFLQMGMEGGENDAQWITAQLPGRSVWVERKITEDPIPPRSDIRIVGYRLRTGLNEQGETVIEGLERTCQKILAPYTAEEGSDGEGKEIEVVLLSARIRYLRLRYWDGTSWLDRWSGGDLPGAVEISIGSEAPEDETSGDDYGYRLFRRVVYIPVGVRAHAGGRQ